MGSAQGRLNLPVNGEDISVPDARYWRCPKCREVVLGFSQARRLRKRAVEIYRRKHRLLSPGEIRSLRQRSRLTRVTLGRLLRLEPRTISRWESGRNVQPAAVDVLLRLIRDLPGGLDYLRKHAA